MIKIKNCIKKQTKKKTEFSTFSLTLARSKLELKQVTIKTSP